MTRYFESPAPRSFFLLEAESLENGHPLFEAARRNAQAFVLRIQRDKMVSDFIQRKLKRAGKKMASDAQELLESRVGEAFIFLDSLLDQLILSAGEKPEIGRSDVERFDEKLARFEGFDLLETLARRELAGAIEILNDLLEASGQDLPSLIGLLHWQLRRFWEARKGLEEGRGEREIASKLRLYSGKEQVFFKQVRHFTVLELEKILEGLFELDWKLKSGRAEGRCEIEDWLARAIG